MSKLNFGDKVEVIVKVNGETVSISAEELFCFFNKPYFYLFKEIPYDFHGVCFLIQEQATCYYEPGRQLHRIDGPAKEYIGGSKYWYLHGKLHREGGPAIDRADGHKEWYKNGKQHRLDGPAIELANGGKCWYLNGKRHRVDGPAIEDVNGYKEWWIDNHPHREDGPAREFSNGDKEWWFRGKVYREQFTNETWKKFIRTL